MLPEHYGSILFVPLLKQIVSMFMLNNSLMIVFVCLPSSRPFLRKESLSLAGT